LSKIIKDARIDREPVVVSYQQPDESVAPEYENNPDKADLQPAVFEIQPEIVKEVSPQETAALILAEARSSADALLEQAKIEAAKLADQAREESHRRGYEEGRNQGLSEADLQMRGEIEKMTEQAKGILKAADSEAKAIILAAEPQIIELVMSVTRKILIQEIEERPAAVLTLVKNALSKIRDQDEINIRVSPDDYDFLLQSRRELQQVVGLDHAIIVSVDPMIERGGCAIDTAFGTVDAGIDTQLDMIRRALQEVM